MEYKVLITSAGTGSRLGDLSKNINKSLISIYTKPVISYIIEKFPKNIEIVLAVGYKAELLKDFIRIAYPDRTIRFVDVDVYDGPGSGLGYTILKCESYLQCPFIFCTNDTIVLEEIPKPDHNWIGYDDVYNNSIYRSLKINIETNLIDDINEKGYNTPSPALIGISGILDYQEFWKIMKDGISYGSITGGETYGIKKILYKGFKAQKFTWYDTGSIEGVEKTQKYFDTGEYNFLRKSDESIWFIEDKVIKFSNDKDFIFERVERNKRFTSKLIPKIIDFRENFYSYNFMNGIVLSKCINLSLFKQLTNKLKLFWEIKKLSENEEIEFRQKCFGFYQYKTYKRIDNYFVKSNYIDSEEIINGIKVPKIMDLLEKIDWNNISNGIPCVFHGDLHFENIVLTDAGNFLLLDWRQNFADLLDYGDLYYDLAKLLHGIIVSHEIVNKNFFVVKDNNNNITLNIYRNQTHVEIEEMFYKFLKNEGYDIQKVKILTALIYLNIASLHHYPYSKFLYFFGKYMLNNILNEGY
jgi:thiamine kinase-like enzyme